jgi:hypothetical protein
MTTIRRSNSTTGELPLAFVRCSVNLVAPFGAFPPYELAAPLARPFFARQLSWRRSLAA